jgi:hypothetical protein
MSPKNKDFFENKDTHKGFNQLKNTFFWCIEMVELIAKVIAYGVPALLIILGFSAYTGGRIAELVFGTTEGMVTLGIVLMIIGITIYIVEIFMRFF